MFKNKSKEEQKYLILTIGVVSFSFIFIFLWLVNVRQIFFPVLASNQANQEASYWQELRESVLGGIEEMSVTWSDIDNSQKLIQGENLLNDLKNKIEKNDPCYLGEEC